MSPERPADERSSGGPFDGRPTWESLIDRQIREAMAAGEFENLPYQGERIPIDDDGSELALAHHLLKQAGFAPGWIATAGEIRSLLAERDAIHARARRAGPPVRARDRTDLAALVGRINGLVLRLEIEAPAAGQRHRRLDPTAELRALEAAAAEG